MKWKSLVKYPQLIPKVNGEHEDILDTLEELLPIVYERSSTDTFLLWIRTGVEFGLITEGEKINLQVYLINGYGGF